MKPKIKLIGEEGNAFIILHKCVQAMNKAGYSTIKIDKIVYEMMSDDYDHLIQVVMKEFEVE